MISKFWIFAKDASKPVADIARRVGMSVTHAGGGFKNLKKMASLQTACGLAGCGKAGAWGCRVFVAIKTDQHNADWLAEFASMIKQPSQKWWNFTV